VATRTLAEGADYRVDHLQGVLHDLPARDQRGADGTTDGPQQRSAILSVAGTCDLMPELTTSARLGYRMSDIAARAARPSPMTRRR
jgi:hypothetical protein